MTDKPATSAPAQPAQGPYRSTHDTIFVANGRIIAALWETDRPRESLAATARLLAASWDLLEIAKAYEAWEAELILCSAAWTNGLPAMTQELYEKWMTLRRKRNAAIAKAETP